MKSTDLDSFTRAYIECALWAETADGSPEQRAADPTNSGTFDRSFDRCGYTPADLSPDALARIVADCARFQDTNHALLEKAYEGDLWESQGDISRRQIAEHYDESRAGHDFWLTRNGHGAGFWGRSLGDVGDRLTIACKRFPECRLYMGDDGSIRIAP